MEQRRIFLAVLISLALLWTWAAIAPKFFPELARAPKPATSTATTTSTAAATKPASTSSSSASTSTAAPAGATLARTITSAQAQAALEAESARTITVETREFTARFTNRGAELVSFALKSYRDHDNHPVELVKARDPKRIDFPFAIEAADRHLADRLNSALYVVNQRDENGQHVVEFRYAGADGVTATKTFRLGDDYVFNFAVAVTPTIPYRVVIGPGIRTLAPDEKDTQIVVTGNGVVQRNDSLTVVKREKGDRLDLFNDVDYVGVEDNYFLTVLRPEKPTSGIIRAIDIVTPNVKDKRRELYAGLNATDGVLRGTAFFGPKQATILDKVGLEKTMQFGMFGIISRFFLLALVWINQATHNYGWAIVVLTIIIKVVLYPLQHKSIMSMKRMQKLQPKVDAIKNRYKKSKTDPEQRQKMNMEVMQLYQKEGINPMGGCLPVLMQLPILWGFYGLLSRAIELRGAPWIGWIHDLSSKDPYYVLPIIMVITMFIQQYITPTTVDPAQRRMFLFMPLIFGIFFKEFPSGLVLYWLVQNVLSIIQQYIMNKWWENHPDNVDKVDDDRKLRRQQ